MITIAILVSMITYTVPVSYPQDAEETTTFGEYGDPMSAEYGWAGYLANGGERTGYNPGPAPDIATAANRLWTSTTNYADGMVALNGLVVFSTGSGMGGGGASMELVFIVVGVIAVAVIAVVAYMYLKKRK